MCYLHDTQKSYRLFSSPTTLGRNIWTYITSTPCSHSQIQESSHPTAEIRFAHELLAGLAHTRVPRKEKSSHRSSLISLQRERESSSRVTQWRERRFKIGSFFRQFALVPRTDLESRAALSFGVQCLGSRHCRFFPLWASSSSSSSKPRSTTTPPRNSPPEETPSSFTEAAREFTLLPPEAPTKTLLSPLKEAPSFGNPSNPSI